MSKDVLVSRARILEGISTVEEEIAQQRRLRADTDPFFKHTGWVLEELRVALREAEAQYRPTPEVADLTGWSEETLRRHARVLHEGGAPPREWANMIVRRDGSDWSFLLATVPIKSSAAA